MQKLQRYFLDRIRFFRVLAILLTALTILLGVLWYFNPDGNYEPVITVIGSLAALIGVPSLIEALHSPGLSPDKASPGDLEILPINRSGHNLFSMSLGEKYFNVFVSFWLKSPLPAEIVKIDLFYEPYEHIAMEQHIWVDDIPLAIHDYAILNEPLRLEAGRTRRMQIRRRFWATLPDDFDPQDTAGNEIIRDDLDYGRVLLKFDLLYAGSPGVTTLEKWYRLGPGGKLLPAADPLDGSQPSPG